MSQECIFCKIVRGEIPATIVYQDEQAIAFRDINPQAPMHVLVVPNRHIDDITALSEEDEALAGHLLRVAAQVAAQEGLATPDRGFRVLVNYGEEGGLVVHHLHVHVLGGRKLGWPPG